MAGALFGSSALSAQAADFDNMFKTDPRIAASTGAKPNATAEPCTVVTIRLKCGQMREG
ncbi:hypothetical protein ACFVWP_33010 [Streptomyces sp. NPDC058175]|uniref:hypothetical protein n=1 Tax=Streptomyces sp. NPDC058175 TaxID=3346367 RepID=UPI0036E1F1C6